MQKIRVPITNFAFGEVSESTLMRTDTPIYQSSAQAITNMIMLAEGGVKRRPGIRLLDKLDLHPDAARDTTVTSQARLLPFIFSGDEQYLVGLCHEYIYFWRYNAATGETTYLMSLNQDVDTNALPFDKDYLHEYTYAQYGDVMFIAHPLFMVRQIVRTSLTTFEVRTMSFDERNDGALIYQPYSSFQSSSTTLSASATTGTVTLTTSEDYFDTTGLHDDVIFRYHDTEVQITSVTNATTATAVVNGTLRQRLSILNPFRTIDGSATVEVTHLNHGFAGGETIIIEEASAVGGINTGNLNGTRTISGIIDENTYAFTAGGSASSAEDGGGYVKIQTSAPTTVWQEQPFSALRGYPAAVCFHENRLIFGGTIAQPDSIWMSKSGSFYNFDTGEAADDDAINLVGANTEVHEIRYIKSNRDLQVFTATSELYVPTYLNQSITPTNAQIRRQTPYGTMFVEPHSLDGATLFTQVGGRVVREFIYTDAEDAYTSTAVSTIASHLITNPKSQAVVHGAFGGAESYAVFPCTCGKMTMFTSNRAEKRAGWFKFFTDGSFYDATSIDDQLFVLSWVNTGVSEELILGQFDYDYLLDCSAKYTPTSNEIDVSAQFDDGRTVTVVINGEDSGTLIVSGGVIDFTPFYEDWLLSTGFWNDAGVWDDTASWIDDLGLEVEVGTNFVVALTTNPVDAMLSAGPETGEIRGISTVVLDLVDTNSVIVNGRPVPIETSEASPSYTGKKEVRLLGYSRDPNVTVSQSTPLPLQVNGIVAEVVV